MDFHYPDTAASRKKIAFERKRNPTNCWRNRWFGKSKQKVSSGFRRHHRSELHSFKNLELQGLSQACDPTLTFLKRLFWGTAWLILLVCCIVQLVVSLNLYISGPTNTNISYQKKKFVPPPCVTFCTSDEHGRLPSVWQPLLLDRFGNISYETTGELLTQTYMDISILWNISRFSLDQLEYDIAMGNRDTTNGKTKINGIAKMEINTVTGVCLTFKPVIQLPCTGQRAYLHIYGQGKVPDGFDEYQVVFHSEEEIPLLHYYGTSAGGVPLPLQKEVTVVLRLLEEQHVTSWNTPCLPEDQYFQCEAECFEELIRYHSSLNKPCRLPFMKQNESLPVCTTAHELKEIQRATAIAYEKILDDDASCKCPQPCTKMIYQEDYIMIEDDEEDDGRLFKVFVEFPKCGWQVVSESYTYGTANFISDVGGSLGLYLGMSILSILAVFEVLIYKFSGLGELAS